jgi:hypothetical protein
VNDTLAAMNRLKNTRDLAEKHIHSLEKGHLPGEESKKLPQPELLNRLLDSRIVCLFSFLSYLFIPVSVFLSFDFLSACINLIRFYY